MELFGTAVVLAGGKSSRMGFDKQFLKINDRRVMDRLIDCLKKEFKEIIIVTNRMDRYNEYNLKIVEDEVKGKGPLSGLHAGLKSSTSKYVYFTACDMPNLNIDYIRFMKEKIRDIDIDACVTRKDENLEPFNAFYSIELAGVIEKLITTEVRSLFSLVKGRNTFYIEEKEARKYSPDWSMFFNLNTIQDIARYMEKETK